MKVEILVLFQGQGRCISSRPLYIAGSSFVIGYLVSLAVGMGNFPSRRQGIIMGAINGIWWIGQSLFNYLYTVAVTHTNGRPEVGNIFLIIGVSVFVVKGSAVFLIHSVPMDEDDVECPTLIKEGRSSARAGEAESRIADYGSGAQQGVDAGDELKESCFEKLGLQMFLEPDFHCIACGFIIAIGANFMYMGNVSSISASLSLVEVHDITLIVAPIAALVFTLASGWLSDCTRNAFPRSVYMVVGGIFNTILFAISSVYGASSAVFILTTLVIYGTTGMIYTMAGTIMGERFGLSHFKRNFGLVLMGSAVMTLVTSSIFGALYDRAIGNKNVRFCKGIACVQNSFIFGCLMSLVSVACFILFERRLILQRFRRIK